ncbi:RdgB/HAM1 family non-canonical purine NTP pyrophosphatase [Spirochaeta cellobiosiphila]|uniref:RdgB/HAM1 family non-canonical purine NTP pyrophosphatase n=1 Tax=Spirochaeta cellobiosiphila TaxID=504483 RepID=UPI000426CC4D|nr:RdgB/HAM1 family non-canonical purine NTP pyrophosphatase [Spirochaeta cellobiosiphila]
MTIFLATNNQHKADEIRQIFKEHQIITPRDKGIDIDPEETGSTFIENALIKAKAFFDITGIPTLADDSGIVVDYLKGAPGIYSARFGNENGLKLTDPQRNEYLLSKMGKTENRKAHYVCNMVYYKGFDNYYSVQETFHGQIISEPAGTGGFGYDPIFYLPHLEKTAAELSAEEKNLISHRGKAVRKIFQMISGEQNG